MTQIKATGSKGHHTFYLNVNEDSTDISSNTSKCSYSFTMYGGSWDFNHTSASISWGITLGDKSYSGSFGKYDKNTTLTISSGSNISITHNDDGNKTINISFWVSDGINKYYTTGNCSASGTLKLTYIARKSNISMSKTSFNVGEDVYIYTNRKSTSFTHSLFIQKSDNSYSQIATGITDNYNINTSAIRNIICSNSTNSKKYTKYLLLRTFNGSTPVGDTTIQFTAYINYKPSVGTSSYIQSNTLVNDFTGNNQAVVENNGYIDVTINGAAGTNSSTISTYTLKNGSNIYTSNSNVIRANIYSDKTFYYYVTDSRGNTSNEKSFSIADNLFYNYNVPTISNITADRTNDIDTTVTLAFDVTISSITKNRTDTILKYAYAEAGSNTYSDYITLDKNNITDNKFTLLLSEEFNIEKSYSLKIILTDYFSEITKTVLLGSAKPELSIRKDMVGINCIPDESKGSALQINGQPLADFIIEQGISGIWTYRKWNSGIAECWGFWQEVGIAIKTPQRGAYMSALMTETLPFVFYGTSIISGHVSNSMWFGNTWVSSGTNTLNYTISRATAADSDSCDIRMFVIGKWK